MDKDAETDLLEILETAPGLEGAEGMTVREVAARLGVCRTTARDRIREAMEAGTAEFAGYRRSTRMDGKRDRTPVYRVVRKSGPRNKRS